ncbi:MAG: hypothetical protein FD131_771 [Rhodocyclaceae bacterium]|nr:MAG: hypothetical protein FD131_771 [Rhodocyclaceae bacterium]
MNKQLAITMAGLLLSSAVALAADKYPQLAPLPPAPIPKDNPQSPEKIALFPATYRGSVGVTVARFPVAIPAPSTGAIRRR